MSNVYPIRDGNLAHERRAEQFDALVRGEIDVLRTYFEPVQDEFILIRDDYDPNLINTYLPIFTITELGALNHVGLDLVKTAYEAKKALMASGGVAASGEPEGTIYPDAAEPGAMPAGDIVNRPTLANGDDHEKDNTA